MYMHVNIITKTDELHYHATIPGICSYVHLSLEIEILKFCMAFFSRDSTALLN